jgi:hypothetical protein
MTTKPAPTPTTSQRTYRSSPTTQHNHATTDPPTSRQRLKIKYLTAYPTAYLGITIRRNNNPDKTGAQTAVRRSWLLILKGWCEQC